VGSYILEWVSSCIEEIGEKNLVQVVTGKSRSDTKMFNTDSHS
jgi:hypothetical protein